MTRALVFVLLAGCSSNNGHSGVLNVGVDTHQITVGGSSSIYAYFTDNDAMSAVGASWSTTPDGIVKLSDLGGNYQKVTGLAAGTVVVTASAQGQTAKTSFTVQ